MCTLAAYWLSCWVFIFLVRPDSRSVAISRNRIKLLDWLVWLPVLGILVVTITKATSFPSLAMIAPLLAMALVNGVTEEFFWRRMFANVFPDDRVRGLVLPWILFTLLHVALLRIPNVRYEGGPLALVGGACMMGALWGLSYWFNRNLLGICSAHVIANVFAFFMLASDNNWVG